MKMEEEKYLVKCLDNKALEKNKHICCDSVDKTW